MANKKQKEASIKSSILILLLILILLISSTYAWFTANKNLTISSLQVNVEASNGIQISTDASNWKTIISQSDITTGYENHTNQLPVTLAPVSTAKGVVDGKLQLFDGDFKPNETTGLFELTSIGPETDARGNIGKYIAFDIFLKVNEGVDVYLSNGSVVTDDRGLASAARVAFINEGNRAYGQSANQYTGLAEGTPTSTIIWEPNNEVHKAEAKANATSVLGMSGPIGDVALNTFGVGEQISTPIPAAQLQQTHGTQIVQVTNDISTPSSGVPANTNLMHLNAGVTKVRIYMWIEGQDIDCEDSASGANVTFDLKFNIA